MSAPATRPEDVRFERLRPRTRTLRRRLVVAFGVVVGLTALVGSLPDAPVLAWRRQEV